MNWHSGAIFRSILSLLQPCMLHELHVSPPLETEWERVRDNDKRAFLALRRQWVIQLCTVISVWPGHIRSQMTPLVTVAKGVHAGEATRLETPIFIFTCIHTHIHNCYVCQPHWGRVCGPAWKQQAAFVIAQQWAVICVWGRRARCLITIDRWTLSDRPAFLSLCPLSPSSSASISISLSVCWSVCSRAL